MICFSHPNLLNTPEGTELVLFPNSYWYGKKSSAGEYVLFSKIIFLTSEGLVAFTESECKS